MHKCLYEEGLRESQHGRKEPKDKSLSIIILLSIRIYYNCTILSISI